MCAGRTMLHHAALSGAARLQDATLRSSDADLFLGVLLCLELGPVRVVLPRHVESNAQPRMTQRGASCASRSDCWLVLLWWLSGGGAAWVGPSKAVVIRLPIRVARRAGTLLVCTLHSWGCPHGRIPFYGHTSQPVRRAPIAPERDMRPCSCAVVLKVSLSGTHALVPVPWSLAPLRREEELAHSMLAQLYVLPLVADP